MARFERKPVRIRLMFCVVFGLLLMLRLDTVGCMEMNSQVKGRSLDEKDGGSPTVKKQELVETLSARLEANDGEDLELNEDELEMILYWIS